MKKRTMGTWVLAVWSICCFSAWGQSQKGDLAALLGYPQLIVYNGKIVTMDDASFESKVGTITQAMAIRDGKILATGANARIQALAGPQTKSIDLKGRMVLPGFFMTHEHPLDWAFSQPQAITHALPNDNVVVHRFLQGGSAKEQLSQFEPTLREAVTKAKPGQWILIGFNQGRDYQWSIEVSALFGRDVQKTWVDEIAPNNPVTVQNGFTGGLVNQRALDELVKVHPNLEIFSGADFGGLPMGEAGRQYLKTGLGFSRLAIPDVMFQNNIPALAQVLKNELLRWARYGVTTFGSSPYAENNLRALSYLDNKGEMPARFAWGYLGPDYSTDTLYQIAAMTGHGTDHLWLAGAWPDIGTGCMSVAPRSGAPDACHFEPDSRSREILERIIATGNRVATMHTGGDKDIDYYLDAIEQASKKAGMTLEEIRAKRHTFDHGSGAPRPDQIPRLKNLGMMASENNTYLWVDTVKQQAERYGIEYANWTVPRKSMTDGEVMTSAELDKPRPEKVFPMVLKGMNRLNDRDGKVYGPRERTDRIIQLKALTRWGAYYVLRENLLGTLEPGKFADFIVIDRDFLTIPENDIPNIEVLMTVVQGKTVHLEDPLAREVGMPPVGFTTWKDPIPAGW